MPPPAASEPARIETHPPRLLTGGAVFVVCLYGAFMLALVLVALLAVSVLQLGLLTWLIPLATFAAETFFLPFGFGNPHVARLVRSLNPGSGMPPERFIAQLTLAPRLRSGFRALMEDADDIGWLGFTGSALVFWGDSVQLSIPFAQISAVRAQSIGLRGLFLYPSIMLSVSGLPGVQSLTLAERSAWLLLSTRARTREIRRRLVEKMSPGMSAGR